MPLTPSSNALCPSPPQAAAKTPSSQRFHHIAADVSEPGYGAALLAAATAWNGGRTPDVVWQVAGMSTPLLWTDEAALAACRRNMDVNFWGAAELAHAVFRAWTSSSSSPAPPPRSPPRQLIFTASSAAFFAVAGYGPYSPSKWAMRALADTLAQEALLFPNHPVRVRVVYPGTTLSPGFERENTTKPAITTQLEKDDPRQTPDEAAASILKGLRAGHHYVTVSYLGELMRLGVLGGSIRNNWVYDIIGAWIAALAWIFVQPFIHGEIRGFAKKHGHPDTYAKKT